MKALDDSGLLYLWGKIKSIFSKATNWQNGSATGSVRTSGSAAESSSYTIGQYSVAEGRYTKAIGSSSHAEGYYATASGNYSHAEGASSTASAQASHAEGNYTEASYSASHAEGDHTVASGYCSHAEGNYTTASAEDSHAEGGYTTASGYYSHAEGNNTTASGDYSHAEGYTTTASGDYSHAGGYGTTARRKSQTAIGEYNVLDPNGSTSTRGDYAFIVGNGTSSSARSNAYALEWDGDSTQAGRATTKDMSSADITDFITGLGGLGTLIFNAVYPVGSYYETSDSTFNPNVTFGGTWKNDTTIQEQKYLLWTNTSSSTFGAQTVPLSLSAFDAVEITTYNTGNDNFPVTRIRKGYASCLLGANHSGGTSSSAYLRFRTASVTSTGVTFGAGSYCYRDGGAATSNNNMVPHKIYGIKEVTRYIWHRTA